MSKFVEANWYDYPQYYDMAVRDDTGEEADFIEAAAEKYCPPRAQRRFFEPACGTGRLVAELAKRGHDVVGLDLNSRALSYLRRRLARRKLQAEVLHADMADFRLTRPCDVAFCLVNSFRHLLTEAAARRHLQCVAASLRPGGIYLLGLHLLPPDISDESCERWHARHAGTSVSVTLRVVATDVRARRERLRVSILVRPRRGNVLRFRDEFDFRMYNARQFKRLLRSVPSLELRDVYDFWYDIDQPLRLDDCITDTVFVLQKREA